MSIKVYIISAFLFLIHVVKIRQLFGSIQLIPIITIIGILEI